MIRKTKIVDLISKVTAVMNEFGKMGDPIPELTGDTLIRLDHYIRTVLPDAILAIYKMAPVDLLPTTQYGSGPNDKKIQVAKNGVVENVKDPAILNSEANADGKIYAQIELPDGYLRLVRVKLKAWNKSVSRLALPGESTFASLYNKYTDGTIRKPKAALVYSTRGRMAIECHPGKITDGSPLDYLVVVEIPKIVNEKGEDATGEDPIDKLFVELDDRLLAAICYMAASLVYTIFEKKTSSDEMERKAHIFLRDYDKPHQQIQPQE